MPTRINLSAPESQGGVSGLDRMTEAKLWRNPCPFAFRLNYLALRYNSVCYDWVQQTEGLSRIEYVVIYSLGLCEGGQARDIAQSSGFPKNSLSRAISRLEKLGLVTRRRDPNDGRSQALYLTKEGGALFRRTLPAFELREKDMLNGLSEDELRSLSHLLAKVVLNCAPLPGELPSEFYATDDKRSGRAKRA
jgi:DNA-binding MarR family transcriptional regulator